MLHAGGVLGKEGTISSRISCDRVPCNVRPFAPVFTLPDIPPPSPSLSQRSLAPATSLDFRSSETHPVVPEANDDHPVVLRQDCLIHVPSRLETRKEVGHGAMPSCGGVVLRR